MARIIVSNQTLVGRKLLALNAQIIQASNDSERLKAIVDQITNSGATPAALETLQGEAQLPGGTGAAIYTGIGQIVTALAGLASLVSAIDQG